MMFAKPWRLFIALCLLLGSPDLGWCAEETSARGAREIAQEVAALEQARNELERQRAALPGELARLATRNDKVSSETLAQAQLEVEAAEIQGESAALDIASARQTVKEMEAALRDLEVARAQSVDPEEGDGLTRQIREKRELLGLERQHLGFAEGWREIYRQRLENARRWLTAVDRKSRADAKKARIAALTELAREVREKHSEQRFLIAALRSESAALSTEDPQRQSQRELLSARIWLAEEEIELLKLSLKLAQAEHQLAAFESLQSAASPSGRLLEPAVRQAAALERAIVALGTLIDKKLDLAIRRKLSAMNRGKSPERDEEAALLNAMIKRMEERTWKLDDLLNRVQEARDDLREKLKGAEKSRLLEFLPIPTDLEGWTLLVTEFALIPLVLLQRSWEIAQDLVRALNQADTRRWASLAALELAWLGGLFALAALVRRVKAAIHHRNFSGRAAIIALSLIQRNVIPTALIGGLLLAAWHIGLSKATVLVLAAGTLPLLAAKILIDLAWRILMSPEQAEELRQPKVYRQLFWILLTGGALISIVLLGHLGFFSVIVRHIGDRLFMVFVLFLLFPVWKIRGIALARLENRFGKRDWVRVAHLLSLLIPISIFVAVALGIFGFINLAAALGLHLGWFLVILAGWLVANGLTRDAFHALMRWAARDDDHSMLFSQGILSPLHKVARIAVFIGAGALLFKIYGWEKGSPVVTWATGVLEHPLFNFAETDVSLQTIVIAGLVAAFLFWLGKWSREIAYRWLLGGVGDMGVRNSLAVFTQYSVVLIGFFVALRYAGLDLTSLAIFAGALGVGIGFGMQTIANNFISGILLLIERPLRRGDIVVIAGNEGWVTRIGIRSLTVLTRDNEEVIIPNSEVITSPFVNWTHTDNTVRTVIYVGVSYDDDLDAAQKVMQKSLEEHDLVLKRPKPMVWLWEFADSSVNFRVQFCSDVRNHQQFQIKSDILFAIWNGLKEAGITIPFPQRDLHVKSVPDDAPAKDMKEAVARMVEGKKAADSAE